MSSAKNGTIDVQRLLDENQQLIMAIMEGQKLGKLGKIKDCEKYQEMLQRNLITLGTLADSHINSTNQTPPTTTTIKTTTTTAATTTTTVAATTNNVSRNYSSS